MAKATTDTVQEYKALREEIERGDIKPFYLLFGKEHYYIDELCRLLMEKVVPPEERDFGQIVYFGADVSAEEAEKTGAFFAGRFPDAEISVVSGGQPVYYYMIAFE